MPTHTVFFDPDADIPDLRYDAAFKAVFAGENPRSRRALSGLISACIGHTVSVISLAANEPAPASVWDKQIRYDIACRLDSGELADVEMTLYPTPDEPFREEYFAARLFTGQDIKGAEYRKLKNVYQINIIANGILCKDEELVHTFRFHDAQHGLSFDGRMHIITIELAKAERLAREKTAGELGAAEAWAVFLRYHPEKEKRALVNEILKAKEDIAMAGEAVQAFTQEEIEWFRNESKLKYQLDMLSMQAREARLEREAREEGLAEGREIGRAEALQEAEKKNHREKRETARRFKAMGLSPAQITEGVGLSPEEVEEL